VAGIDDEEVWVKSKTMLTFYTPEHQVMGRNRAELGEAVTTSYYRVTSGAVIAHPIMWVNKESNCQTVADTSYQHFSNSCRGVIILVSNNIMILANEK
jgi:hypothetical protein